MGRWDDKVRVVDEYSRIGRIGGGRSALGKRTETDNLVILAFLGFMLMLFIESRSGLCGAAGEK
jgi:hypothetical protein